MDASPSEQQPSARTKAGGSAGRVAAFLAALALTAAVGWQAGRMLEPPLPVPAVTHGHPGTTP